MLILQGMKATTPPYFKKGGKNFFSGASVWGLWQNNAMRVSQPLTTHIDMICYFCKKLSEMADFKKIGN